MGRKVKRVPLDFKWPKDMPWKGYICPYRPQVRDGVEAWGSK